MSRSNRCAVIPAYNESTRIEPVIKGLLSFGIPVLVVDDGSDDNTSLVAETAGAYVFRFDKNRGKGAALVFGLSYAKRQGYTFAVILDADGQHLPTDVLRLLAVVEEKDADLVIGNRMDNLQGMPFIRRITNRLMSAVLRILTGAKIPDTQCGLKVLRLSSFNLSEFRSRRFDWESELVIKATRKRLRIVSESIRCVYNTTPSSRIRVLPDTLRFIWLILRNILY
jgi:glycosyltransferase involved in cell wall biosynthesis